MVLRKSSVTKPITKKGPKIQICGPSGVGKTTLAKALSENYQLPFISGSYYDLVPEAKDKTHKDILDMNPADIYKQDLRLLKARLKISVDNENGYISDRAIIDTQAYNKFKLNGVIPQCDLDVFQDSAVNIQMKSADIIIFIPFTKSMIDTWQLEDNKRRIVNPDFQYNISQVMEGIIGKRGENHQYETIPWLLREGIGNGSNKGQYTVERLLPLVGNIPRRPYPLMLITLSSINNFDDRLEICKMCIDLYTGMIFR